jgi:23S rRNA (pseudouridine1915-N3)-methyltransferase
LRILLVAVGRAKAGLHRDLEEVYQGRLTMPLTIVEVEERRKLPAAERRLREGELLLARVPPRATVVALDERGKSLASADFAAQFSKWQGRGADLVFLIGGADGHADAVRERADAMLSFGPMTWPHLLVRTLLLEQLYRAQQILAGHPYHRD